MACAFLIYSQSSGLTSGVKKLALVLRPSSWRIVDDPSAFPPEFWQLFLPSNLTALGEKCRLRRNDVETPPCGRDHAAVATATGGVQPRGEAVWGRSTRGGGAGSATR